MSLFVTFEGPDGAGKSTQVRLVSERLQRAGAPALITREPGGTPLGERIRSVLLDPGACAIVPRAEALLMTAARAQHVADVISPALNDGLIVLCDRFTDSTLAYQGAGRGLPEHDLQELQAIAIGDLRPSLTILLDLPATTGLQRRHDSGTPLNRLDQDEIDFHERVREWYVEAARREPSRWRVFDAEQSPEVLAEDIALAILSRNVELSQSAGTDRTSS